MHVRLLIFLLGFASVVHGSEPLLDAPGPAIVVGENDAAWEPLFAALAGKGSVVAPFTERRWFQVRKQPVVVEGEMRLAPGRGLSLRYGDRTVIVDEQGMLLRDARGRTRVVRPDDRAPPVNTWLLPVLRFDLPALRSAFRVLGAREGDAWRLDFVPRDAAGDKGIGTIVVHGTGETITRIDLHPKPGLRIEIVMGDARSGVEFGAEELEHYFR